MVQKEFNHSPGSEGLSYTRKIEERLDILAGRMDELMKLINLKTERLSVKQRMMEERHDEMTQDFQKRLMAVITKSADLPKMELKIQELFERHNQAVRNFDSRMNHFRKVIETQEIQLFKTATELEESRREIARLKRS